MNLRLLVPTALSPLLLAMLATQACAGDIVVPAWQTSAELGAIATTGNTVGTTVTGKIDVRQELEDWTNQYIAAGHFKEDQITSADGGKVDKRSAERYSLSGKAAYKLMEKGQKLFVLATHVEDKFGAYTEYSTIGVGRGTRWYSSADASVDVEFGPGYFVGERSNGDSESGVTVRGAAAIRWQISDAALFSQTISVERGTSNVHSIAEAALSTKIIGSMHMKAAIVARNDSNVPANKKNTDTQTTLTLVYSF